MNVSSVKNLNGETFSAVQDAYLTNVIQTNSGNWQDITAYQNASAMYLTEVSIPESATWNEVSTTVQTNSAQWGQGGGASNSFYIYPGKTTDKEISENSGKDLKLYNSANNVFLDFAGKSTLSKYTMFSFKEITGTQANKNTVQHLRLRVYPNATSACKVYDTNTVNLLDSNSTVSTAQTAYYDGDGNYLTQTHNDLIALNAFVQSNSASWGQGGGGSDIQSNGIWVTRNSTGSNKIINNSNDNLNISFYTYSENQPLPININGSEYYWNQNYDGQYNWYCNGPDINSNNYVEGIPQDYLIRINNVNWAESKSAQINTYGVRLYGDKVIFSAEYNGDSDTYYIEAYDKNTGSTQLISSFNMTTHPGLSALFESNISNTEWMQGYIPNPNNSYNIMMSFPGEGGSTVASGDVFPPTNNLEPQTTYYLGWNANNGGLFWYHP